MKPKNKYRISIVLSVCAFIVTLAAFVLFLGSKQSGVTALSIPNYAYILIPLIAGTSTFIFSSLGIYLVMEKSYSPFISALFGFILGTFAFFSVALPTIFLSLPPSFYQHILGTLTAMAFVFGGFLAPLFGAIIGYWMAKKRIQAREDSVSQT